MAEPMTPLDVKVEANRCLNCSEAEFAAITE
jgi:nitrate reductase cytochrome c-type subunit